MVTGVADSTAISPVRPLRVLVIAFVYPPYPASGSMRAEKVAHALRQRGHHVRVLTAPVSRDERGIRLEQEGLSVRVVRYPRNPRHMLLWLRDRFRGEASSPIEAHTNGAEPSPRGPLIGNLRALLNLPDDEQGFAAAVIAAGLPEIRRGVDLIYTTAPPFSAHLAGLALKRLSGLPWTAEFRDPWTNNPVVRGVTPHTPLTARVDAAMERATVHSADQLIVGTEALFGELADRYGAPIADKLVLARNGIDQVATSPEPPSRAPEFLHLGTLYGSRSPEALLAGFAAVMGNDRPTDLQPSLRFVGGVDDELFQRFGGLARDLGVAEHTRFDPWIQRAEAISLLNKTDFLVLLAKDQPSQVPNKLYEYLGTRKLILALVDDDGESAALLRKAGNHVLLTEDTPDAWAEAFRRAFQRARDGVGAVSRVDQLDQWTTQRQFSHLVSEVEAATG